MLCVFCMFSNLFCNQVKTEYSAVDQTNAGAKGLCANENKVAGGAFLSST